ncbi:MAG: zinc ribbon domain-containing protein [Myxococcales bacterium FL481]|nr:MAG: zinc ribbon domain-containing protein [Myxococcales bacterium FL481]
MPIYEYYCAACDRSFEVIQKVSDPPQADCEFCGAPVKKQLTAAAFHLKGGGWYKDGYASVRSGNGDGGKSGASDTKSSPGKESGASKAAPAPASSNSSSG